MTQDPLRRTGDPVPHDPLALENQICFALAVASRGVISAYRTVLDPLHLTHPQYLVMLALWQNGRLSVREIAGLLRLESATVSPLVKRLEALDYVERVRRTDDERVVDVVLTDTGVRLREQATEVPGRMMERLGMDETALRELHTTMTALIASLERA